MSDEARIHRLYTELSIKDLRELLDFVANAEDRTDLEAPKGLDRICKEAFDRVYLKR